MSNDPEPIEPLDIGEVITVEGSLSDGPAIFSKDGYVERVMDGKLPDGWLNRGTVGHNSAGVVKFTATHRAEGNIVPLTDAKIIKELLEELNAALSGTEEDDGLGLWRLGDISESLRNDRVIQPTELFPRLDDGVMTLYRHKVHWFSGEPESAKSLCAQVACAVEVVRGNNVLYIDFEDDEQSVVDRVRMFGVSNEAMLKHFKYISPPTPIGDKPHERARLGPLLKYTTTCSLVILDGINEGMGSSGFNPNDGRDFYTWWRLVAKPLIAVATGAAFIAIDHVVKDPEKQGMYASGSIQKGAKAHVHYRFNLDKTFGEGLTGRARIRLLKDKPGHLKKYGGPFTPGAGQPFAVFVVRSEVIKSRSDPRVETTFALVSDGVERGKFRPTYIMENLSDYLHAPSTQLPASKAGIEKGTKGDANTKPKALDCLIEEGYVEKIPKGAKADPKRAGAYKGPGGAYDSFAPIKPYKVKDDPLAKNDINPMAFLMKADAVVNLHGGKTKP